MEELRLHGIYTLLLLLHKVLWWCARLCMCDFGIPVCLGNICIFSFVLLLFQRRNK